MKKIFVPVMLLAGVFLLSCTGNSGGMSATAKKNLEANRAITKAYETGEFDKLKDYITADAVDHGGETGDVKGLDSIVAAMKRYRAMMPDMKSANLRELADDEYVFTWSTVTGTMNGQKMTMTSIDVSRFKDGKATEHWIYMDPKELARMMQSMAPPPPAPAGADTTTTN